ncbi:heme ABC exporter, ATP-binding protein CcmA [Alphaproteobacteria bacterium 46_93_T64]|nr:heme ABC exporter, ATP-binding protein CcmA [Alphaproteobacteria bacterium 46_93_T64]
MSLYAQSLTCIRQDRLIFNAVDLSLNPGEILWVKGRNGSGKTSLLRILACLLKPATGIVSWNGTDIEEDPEHYKENLQYVGHQDALKMAMSARENLEFWSDYTENSTVDQALDAFQLQPIADHPTQILSAGQKKRSNLARLIACPAPLWILDEPVSSLDTDYIGLFKDLLEKHVRNGGMALLATHQDLSLSRVRQLDLNQISEVAR